MNPMDNQDNGQPVTQELSGQTPPPVVSTPPSPDPILSPPAPLPHKTNKRRLLILSLEVLAVLLVVGGYYMYKGRPTATNTTNTDNSETIEFLSEATVSITSTGLTPATVSITKGGSVTWTNTDTAD